MKRPASLPLPPPPAELLTGRLRLRSLHLLTLHLGVTLQAGLSLLSALKAVQGGDDRRAVASAAYLRLCVAQGFPLSRSMAALPRIFPTLYVQLVKCAEESGALASIFPRLAEHLEQQSQAWRRSVSSLVYPACLAGFTVGLVALLRFFMVPRLLELGGFTQVPWLTRVVAQGAIPRPMLLVGVLAAATLVFYLRSTWQTPAGRKQVEGWLFGLPLVGPAAYAMLWGQNALALSTMLASGLPLLRALNVLTASGGTSRLVDQALRDVVEALKAGQSVSQAFESTPGVPRLLRIMVRTADATGTLPVSLRQFAAIQEMLWEVRLETALKLFEPALLAVCGLVVGLTLLAAFLPIYGMAAQL